MSLTSIDRPPPKRDEIKNLLRLSAAQLPQGCSHHERECVLALHYAVSWSRVRSKFIASWLDAEPILLYFDGGCLHRTLRRARIRQNDVEAAVRGKGIASLNDVDAVVLEPNGELSILPKQQGHRELIAELRQ